MLRNCSPRASACAARPWAQPLKIYILCFEYSKPKREPFPLKVKPESPMSSFCVSPKASANFGSPKLPACRVLAWNLGKSSGLRGFWALLGGLLGSFGLLCAEVPGLVAARHQASLPHQRLGQGGDGRLRFSLRLTWRFRVRKNP